MPFRIKVTLAILLALLSVAVIGPLILPLPRLENTVPAAQLADPDSHFIEVGDLTVHYKTSSLPRNDEGLVFVLLHGFGSSTHSWKQVVEPLGALGWALAFDRPAFGLTERPRRSEWRGKQNPYSSDAQVDLTVGLMDVLGIKRAILVGNSSGGAIAIKVALEHPGRVAGLILVDAAVYQGGAPPAWSRPLLYTPQLNRLGPLFMRQFAGRTGLTFLQSAWSDPERIDDETYRAFGRQFRVKDWDRALWELSRASREPRLVADLVRVEVPALVISGADDKIVPPNLSERLAKDLPQATLAIFDSCGHLPQEECPEAFLEVTRSWLGEQGFLR